MKNLQKEVWKNVGLNVLRWVIASLGAWLIKKGILDQSAVDSITTPDALLALIGFIAIVATTVWQYFRSKYNVKLPIAALKADPETPLSQVKTDVKNSL